MTWIIEVLQDNRGWRKYLRRFETKELALEEAKNMFNTHVSVKNFKVRKLTPTEEENYEEKNFI